MWRTTLILWLVLFCGLLPHIKVAASEPSSGVVNFQGVTLKSVMERAGVGLGESMKG
jgi:hypothetical protein